MLGELVRVADGRLLRVIDQDRQPVLARRHQHREVIDVRAGEAVLIAQRPIVDPHGRVLGAFQEDRDSLAFPILRHDNFVLVPGGTFVGIDPRQTPGFPSRVPLALVILVGRAGQLDRIREIQLRQPIRGAGNARPQCEPPRAGQRHYLRLDPGGPPGPCGRHDDDRYDGCKKSTQSDESFRLQRANGGLRTESNAWERLSLFWTGSRNAPQSRASVLHPPYDE